MIKLYTYIKTYSYINFVTSNIKIIDVKFRSFLAGIAQLVEQLICNHQVPSSTLGAGTILTFIFKKILSIKE